MNKKTSFFIGLLVLLSACNSGQETARNIKVKKVVKNVVAPVAPVSDTVSRDLSFVSGLKNGDIIFVHSSSSLSLPVSKATHSDYTHCGVYWTDKNGWAYVLEAADTSGKTPVKEFFRHTAGSKTLVLRLKKYPSGLNHPLAIAMEKSFVKLFGRPYDGKFMWDDEKLYCSELVYKLYQEAGIRLCDVKKIRDYDLSSPEVKNELDKRYNGIIPYEEPVVAPVDLIHSPLLDTVYHHI